MAFRKNTGLKQHIKTNTIKNIQKFFTRIQKRTTEPCCPFYTGWSLCRKKLLTPKTNFRSNPTKETFHSCVIYLLECLICKFARFSMSESLKCHSTIVCIREWTHPQKQHPTLSCQAPLLKSANCPSPPIWGNPLYTSVFHELLTTKRFFSERPKY